MRTHPLLRRAVWFHAALLLAACGGPARLPVSAGTGPNPQIPEPRHSLIPTVNVVTAKGWTADATPTPASGLTVTAFARGLEPSALALRAAERRRARRRDERAAAARRRQGASRAGSSSSSRRRPAAPCRARIASRCCATRTATASPRRAPCFSSDLTSPFGMALVGDTLYVANTDALRALPVRARRRRASRRGRRRSSTCRAGRSIITGRRTSSRRPTVERSTSTVGSNSNVGENGIDKEEERAAIWEVDPRDRHASRLRVGAAQSGRHGVGAGERARCGRR